MSITTLRPFSAGLPTAKSVAKEIVRALGRPGVWKCSCPDGEVNEHVIARHVLGLLDLRLSCTCGQVKLRYDLDYNTWYVKGPYYAPYGWVNCSKCDWRVRIVPDLKREGEKGGKGGRWAGRRPSDIGWHYAPGAEAPVSGMREVSPERDEGMRSINGTGRRQGRRRYRVAGTY